MGRRCAPEAGLDHAGWTPLDSGLGHDLPQLERGGEDDGFGRLCHGLASLICTAACRIDQGKEGLSDD